jgi:hypothetical protein
MALGRFAGDPFVMLDENDSDKRPRRHCRL